MLAFQLLLPLPQFIFLRRDLSMEDFSLILQALLHGFAGSGLVKNKLDIRNRDHRRLAIGLCTTDRRQNQGETNRCGGQSPPCALKHHVFRT